MKKDHTVIVYSTPTCPYCTYTKDFLTQQGVTFEDIDVTKDRSKAQEMIMKSGQMGVPVIDIDGTILVGYQPNEFARLLA